MAAFVGAGDADSRSVVAIGATWGVSVGCCVLAAAGAAGCEDSEAGSSDEHARTRRMAQANRADVIFIIGVPSSEWSYQHGSGYAPRQE